MKPLTLVRKPDLSGKRYDLRHISPHRAQDLTLSDIARLPISSGGQPRDLETAFDIHDGDRSVIRLTGDLSRCDHVGSSMQSGVLEVDSSVGDYAAAHMRGGTMRVAGDALDHAFSSMRGGDVTISGNVGQYAGGGDTKGMRGGRAVVKGSAGRWLATRMRRGSIVIHGDVGPGAASRLIAGTIVICGRVESPFGAGMQRGTILLLAPKRDTATEDPPPTAEPIEPIPGFTTPMPAELSFLQLLLRELRNDLPTALLSEVHPQKTLRALGDRAVGGQGEILWLDRADNQPIDW